jgi:hypothetical protein
MRGLGWFARLIQPGFQLGDPGQRRGKQGAKLAVQSIFLRCRQAIKVNTGLHSYVESTRPLPRKELFLPTGPPNQVASHSGEQLRFLAFFKKELTFTFATAEH